MDETEDLLSCLQRQPQIFLSHSIHCMKLGQFEIEQLSEGIFEVYDDGIFHKVDAKDITAGSVINSEYKESITIGIDPILIKTGKQVILLDAGLGWGLDYGSNYTNTSNLKTNLDIFGLKPEDVTHVVLSHLHFDHAAGCTFVDSESKTRATLPNAHYFVQKLEWLFAIESSASKASASHVDYQMDEMYKLHAEERLVLISDASFELLPGITLIHTGGHTPGHQIVKLQSDNVYGYYLGDLVPSELHLNHYFMGGLDTDALQAKKAKTLILRQAAKESAALFFYHSIHTKAGKLSIDDDKQYQLSVLKSTY